MRKTLLILVAVLLVCFAVPASAYALATQDTGTTTTTVDQSAALDNSSGQSSTGLPFDSSLLNGLSLAQLKQLQQQIQEIIKEKEASLKQFVGAITAFDGSSITLQNKTGSQTFAVTTDTYIKVAGGGAVRVGYKGEVLYDPSTKTAVAIKAQPIVHEFTGKVVSFDGAQLVVQRGAQTKKTFNVTSSTVIKGIGKAKTAADIKPGAKVSVRYNLVNDALVIKILSAKAAKNQASQQHAVTAKLVKHGRK